MSDRVDEIIGKTKQSIGNLTGNEDMKRDGETQATEAKAKRETEGAVDQAVGKAEETWGEVIADLLGDLERIQTRRSELAKTIEEVFLSHPLGQVLVTLCGFGPRTGARTLAEIGDPNRFADGSALASYAGLAPTD